LIQTDVQFVHLILTKIRRAKLNYNSQTYREQKAETFNFLILGKKRAMAKYDTNDQSIVKNTMTKKNP
jgi:hypothetical protein